MKKEEYSRLSPEAKKVWAKLGKEVKEIIQHDYVFRRDRDEAIYNLRLRGVKIEVLSEITGLYRATIINVENRVRKDRLFDIRQNLRQIRKAFEDFYQSAIYYIHDKK